MRIGVALAAAHLLVLLAAPSALAVGPKTVKPKPILIKIRTNGEKIFTGSVARGHSNSIAPNGAEENRMNNRSPLPLDTAEFLLEGLNVIMGREHFAPESPAEVEEIILNNLGDIVSEAEILLEKTFEKAIKHKDLLARLLGPVVWAGIRHRDIEREVSKALTELLSE